MPTKARISSAGVRCGVRVIARLGGSRLLAALAFVETASFSKKSAPTIWCRSRRRGRRAAVAPSVQSLPVMAARLAVRRPPSSASRARRQAPPDQYRHLVGDHHGQRHAQHDDEHPDWRRGQLHGKSAKFQQCNWHFTQLY